MSAYSFIASDKKLSEVKDIMESLSINEALERRFKIDDLLLSDENIDKNEKILYYSENGDDSYELIIKNVENDLYSNIYTKKPFVAAISFKYIDSRAEQLIKYLKKEFEKVNELEIWNIWIDEVDKPVYYNYNIDKINIHTIKKIFKPRGFGNPECNIIRKK